MLHQKFGLPWILYCNRTKKEFGSLHAPRSRSLLVLLDVLLLSDFFLVLGQKVVKNSNKVIVTQDSSTIR